MVLLYRRLVLINELMAKHIETGTLDKNDLLWLGELRISTILPS